MNLTYSVTENGYIIYNNGIKWIVQEGFIPPEFINATDKSFAKSAELNIAQIIADDEASKKSVSDIKTMQIELEQNKQDLMSAMVAITEIYETIL